jgi:hypothetical protein
LGSTRELKSQRHSPTLRFPFFGYASIYPPGSVRSEHKGAVSDLTCHGGPDHSDVVVYLPGKVSGIASIEPATLAGSS